jgi:glucose-6-phosphate 1-epimerase
MRLPQGVVFEHRPGTVPLLVVETPRCRARLTPFGAQVCDWTPAGQSSSALFLSPRVVLTGVTPIRGGVPVCFPWFGAHPSDPAKPAHGFVRTRMWEIAEVTRDAAGDVRVAFRLTADAETHAFWSAAFVASLTITLGASFAMAFEVENTGADELTYEAALHTYLSVGDVERIRIHGLERTRFLDKTDGMRERITGAVPLTLAGEMDRVFLDTTATCAVDDPVLARHIRIEKTGSRATVVWNPGRDKAAVAPDIGADAWRNFVCVETASCGPHAVRLAPRATHTMTATISCEGRPG